MINWVLTKVKEELVEPVRRHFTGNIEFQVNMARGEIANMNVSTKKHLRPPKPQKEEADNA